MRCTEVSTYSPRGHFRSCPLIPKWAHTPSLICSRTCVHGYTVTVLHLEHPELPVDNNYLENQIRPFSTGRRAWLFAQNPNGAKASANLYSLVSCARVNRARAPRLFALSAR